MNLNFNINTKLAIAALAFGLLALIIGNPVEGSKIVIDTNEFSFLTEDDADTVSVEQLADWIIKGQTDFRLIDVRSDQEFNEYHIPYAENIKIEDFTVDKFRRNEKIILYCNEDSKVIKGWIFLKANGFKAVYMLKGSITAWKDRILFPKLAADASPEVVQAFEKVKYVSTFFGGKPTIGGTEISMDTPKMEMPKPTAAKTPIQTKKKGKKEGC